MWEIVGDVTFYVIAGLLILAGLGTTIFALPGVWLIWIAILLTGIVKGLGVIPLWFIILSFFFSVFVVIIDNVVIAYGSKKFGGGRWGMIGGVLGAILGFMLGSLLGLFVGSFLGAYALESMMAKKTSEDAFKSGVGSSIGVILSIVLKIFLCIFMVIVYLYLVIF